MLSEDSFQYAIENTHVVRAPSQSIQTFGNTSFRFHLVTELMDNVNQVRVRDGRLHAERPTIITPGYIERELLEGFGEKAHEFLGWLRDQARGRLPLPRIQRQNLAGRAGGFAHIELTIVSSALRVSGSVRELSTTR